MGSKKLKILLALVSCSRSPSRYWYYMVLHTTIGKRRSGAFKQKRVYQNRTIIKEVISKNVIILLALGSGPGGWTGPDPGVGQVRTRGLDRSGPRGWTGPDPADPAPGPAPADPAPIQIRARIQIRSRVRPWRIRPQVLTSNFLLALAPGSGPGLDTGSGPQAGHRVRTPGWTQGAGLHFCF